MARRRVLLCSMDGVRPDAIQASRAETLQRLAAEGSYTWRARTVMPSATLPCHTSMLRGVEPARHGITSNQFQPLVRPVPSLLEVAARHGLRTGMFYNWEQLRDLAEPGTLGVSFMWSDCESAEGDLHVSEKVEEYLGRVAFDLLFVYFGWPDECGHRHGWMSPEYLRAVENADACLGRILKSLEQVGLAGETVTLALSDHGGHDRTHGTDREEDMTIPWLLHGPGIRRGHEIQAPARIEDTCLTLARVLDLPASPAWEGKVIEECFTGGTDDV